MTPLLKSPRYVQIVVPLGRPCHLAWSWSSQKSPSHSSCWQLDLCSSQKLFSTYPMASYHMPFSDIRQSVTCTYFDVASTAGYRILLEYFAINIYSASLFLLRRMERFWQLDKAKWSDSCWRCQKRHKLVGRRHLVYLLRFYQISVCIIIFSFAQRMLYMSHLIRVKGDIEKFPWDEVNQNTPWATLRHEPGQSWSEISNKMNSTIFADGTKLNDKWDNEAFPFRVFKSHGMPCHFSPIF